MKMWKLFLMVVWFGGLTMTAMGQQTILPNGDTAIYNAATGQWVRHQGYWVAQYPTFVPVYKADSGITYWTPAQVAHWADSVVRARVLVVVDSLDSVKVHNGLH